MPGVKSEHTHKEEFIGETHIDQSKTQASPDGSQPAPTAPGAASLGRPQQYEEKGTTETRSSEFSVRPSQLPSESITGAHTYRVFVVAPRSVLHIQVIDSLGRNTYLTFEG